MKLPTVNSIEAKLDNLEKLNPLEFFIYGNEPINKGKKIFRKRLKQAIIFCINSSKWGNEYGQESIGPF